jgi:hypothetical protein
MKTYKIPVEWSMVATLEIQAESLEAAMIEADNLPLSPDGEYIDGSFQINRDVIPLINDDLSNDELDLVDALRDEEE